MRLVLMLTLLSVFSGFAMPAPKDTLAIPVTATGMPSPAVLPEARTTHGATTRVLAHTLLPIIAGGLMSGYEPMKWPAVMAVGYGVLVGPSMGNIYLDDKTGGVGGFAFRLVGGAMGIAGFGLGVGCVIGGLIDDPGSKEATCDEVLPVALMIAGGGLSTGGTIWNLARLPKAARAYREKSGPRPAPLSHTSLAPVLDLRAGSLGMRLSLHY